MENGDSIASVATNHRPSSSITQIPALRMADIVQPMPKGMRVMEMQITATAKTARPKLTKKPGNYSTARSSSSQSMQIPLHTSSAAHQANRFLSCAGDPTLLTPLNVAIRWRMDSQSMSWAMSFNLLQISSWYLS